MTNITFNLKNTIAYSLLPIFLFSCSTEDIETENNSPELFNSTSSNALSISSNEIIALKGSSGYLSADNTYLKCNASSVSDDGEKYEVMDLGNDIIALKSLKTGKYVSSELTRTHGMTANRSTPGAWEKFAVTSLSNNQIALSNTYRGTTKFVSSEGGKKDTYCNRNSVGGSWEKFTIEKLSGSGSGTFNLKDFQIETSWDSSGDDYKKTKSYDYDEIDNRAWYDKVGNTYVLSCEAKDGNRTEWKEHSGKEASLSVNKVMEYTTKITNEPENGVTIAQIHNRGGVRRPYVRVYLEHGEILIKETTSDPSKSSASYNTYDENLKYTQGTNLTVKIETKNGKAYITITTTHGSYSETLTPTDNWKNFSNHYYLKAGVYTEGDDIQPISTFSKFLFTRN